MRALNQKLKGGGRKRWKVLRVCLGFLFSLESIVYGVLCCSTRIYAEKGRGFGDKVLVRKKVGAMG